MKKLFFILAALPVFAFAQEKGVQFVHNLSWDQVKAKAKAEHKYILMDCQTTWCSWCRYMEKNIFPNDTVAAITNDKFIAVSVQFDSSAKDNDEVKSWYATAHDLNAQYHINAYPTFLFFSPDGEIVDRHVGASLKVPEFVTALNDAQNPDKQYYVLVRKYESGDKDPSFLKSFASAAQSAYDMQTAKKAANEYLATQKDLYTKDNLTFLSNFTQSSKDTGFSIMLHQPEKVDAVMGKGTSDKVVQGIIMREEVYPAIFPHNPNIKKASDLPEPDWTALQTKLQTKYPAQATEILAYSKTVFYMEKGDWNNFEPAVVAYMKSYGDKASDEQLNQFAWTVFQNCPDMTCVTEALDWSKKSFQNNSNPEYIDTYANILYKMGKKDEAIAWEQKAADASSDKSTYLQTLDKMKKGEKTWN
ncbi:hypothetical protein A9P82_10810 [Arachidicoccus ginsenosidimutans]|uniref:thioredoxin family protein n=1 Tax=Arachidicoccus sp. BS20 TaxID=1850526 RepID=UPI0007F15925|nr:thioredoxin family protein [Arachidicoccus sp. BS20]ANI89737.1 hypothetical protein A9P82_10810 [Arachidicoccus sp. BS20]